MGLGDNCCPDNGHTTEYFPFFEKVRIPGLNIRIPGFERRFDIRINTIESLQRQYVSSVESHLLFRGKSVHRDFYPVNSPGAKKILQRYKPELA